MPPCAAGRAVRAPSSSLNTAALPSANGMPLTEFFRGKGIRWYTLKGEMVKVLSVESHGACSDISIRGSLKTRLGIRFCPVNTGWERAVRLPPAGRTPARTAAPSPAPFHPKSHQKLMKNGSLWADKSSKWKSVDGMLQLYLKPEDQVPYIIIFAFCSQLGLGELLGLFSQKEKLSQREKDRTRKSPSGERRPTSLFIYTSLFPEDQEADDSGQAQVQLIRTDSLDQLATDQSPERAGCDGQEEVEALIGARWPSLVCSRYQALPVTDRTDRAAAGGGQTQEPVVRPRSRQRGHGWRVHGKVRSASEVEKLLSQPDCEESDNDQRLLQSVVHSSATTESRSSSIVENLVHLHPPPPLPALSASLLSSLQTSRHVEGERAEWGEAEED
ncbi:hypothetical protein SKAU_G00302690 [Synaphobranchus kaupii]|uniref:Uncharacterized protein n=1 Tax=Synaphobranchus kaupii TaxID=118154 RepID=A0A9Q1ING6_SYNKA|nr:hypothetical protein SKAU_G00302690 [Synaphobranchus kaupii]